MPYGILEKVQAEQDFQLQVPTNLWFMLITICACIAVMEAGCGALKLLKKAQGQSA